MALITKAIKGTKDVLPKDVHKNQYIEATALDIASKLVSFVENVYCLKILYLYQINLFYHKISFYSTINYI